MKTIFTAGHSNNSIEYLIEMLQSVHIQILKDIRRFPEFRKYPHFNKDFREKELSAHGIEYLHFED